MTIRDFVNNVRVELDPNQLENGFRQLQERVQRAASDGVHTKVRLKLNGKQLGPDIPLAAFLAAEAATFFYGGLLRALAVNLGMRSFLEINLSTAARKKSIRVDNSMRMESWKQQNNVTERRFACGQTTLAPAIT